MAKIAAIAILLCVVGSIYWAIFGNVNELINFILAAISSSFVIFASYYGYFKMINAKAAEHEVTEDENDEDDDKDEKLPAKSVLIQSYKGWLFPLRLISYVVLVLVFLALSGKQILSIAPFLSGLAVMPISVMIFMYFERKQNS